MEVLKYLPVLSAFFAAVLCIIGLLKWRDFEFNRTFNNYSKRSTFAYEVLSKSGCEDFKRLGFEFGVAAFTGDMSLTSQQRSRILSVSDPVRSLQLYKKCKQYISVQEKGLTLFEWKSSWYKNNVFRTSMKWGCLISYFIFMMTAICVPLYVFVYNPQLLTQLENVSIVKIICLSLLLFFEGFSLGILALLKGSRIAAAERLINENVKASDVILSDISI